jgi:hypothetical protein
VQENKAVLVAVEAAPKSRLIDGEEAPLTSKELNRVVTIFLRETETHLLLEKPALAVNQVCHKGSLERRRSHTRD